jgi:hypothetical protein
MHHRQMGVSRAALARFLPRARRVLRGLLARPIRTRVGLQGNSTSTGNPLGTDSGIVASN